MDVQFGSGVPQVVPNCLGSEQFRPLKQMRSDPRLLQKTESLSLESVWEDLGLSEPAAGRKKEKKMPLSSPSFFLLFPLFLVPPGREEEEAANPCKLCKPAGLS